MFCYLYFCPTNKKTLQDSKTQNGKTHLGVLKFKCVNVFDSKDTFPICSHSHALALCCEPKVRVVTFVPSIQKLWNDKRAYCLVKRFFKKIPKVLYRGPRFGRVKTWSQNKYNTYLLYSSLLVLLPLAQVY
jgi:hypothetical protein